MGNLIIQLLAKKDQLEALSHRLEAWAWGFAVLVAIGVAGEAVIGIRVLLNGKQLRVVQREVDKERERIEAEKERESAQRIAELKKETEKLHGENLALLARIQPRTIPPEKRAGLVESLKGVTPKCKVVVWHNIADPEAFSCGREILNALNEAGFSATEWTPTRNKDGGPARFSLNEPGIIMIIDDPAGTPPPGAAAVAEHFAAVGMPMKLMADPKMVIAKDTMFVWVGRKP